MTMSPSTDLKLRKPVSALAIVPKTGKITALGRKSWNVLLHIAQEQGLEAGVHRAPLGDIIKGLDFNSNDLNVVKGHLRSMVSTTVEWQSPTSGETLAWNVCGLLAHAAITKHKGTAWVEWSYAVNLRHELLDPSVFAKLSLSIMSQLSTHAAVVLYEICTRYKDVGRTPRQSWQWWRPVLVGRPDDERMQKQEYRHLKRDVLRPAIAELNTVADLEVELIEYKTGRFISELQFTIKKKPQRALALAGAVEPVDMALLGRAEKLGIAHGKVELLVAEFGEAALQTGVAALERRIATAFPEPLRDPFRYLKSMMPGHAAEEVAKHEAKITAAAPSTSQNSSEGRLEGWGKAWLTARTSQLVDEISALPTERVAELTQILLEEFERTRAHPALRQTVQAKGWWHPLVRHRMVDLYARGAYGEEWAKPTAVQLLDIAAQGTPTT